MSVCGMASCACGTRVAEHPGYESIMGLGWVQATARHGKEQRGERETG
jgi:hypothetical protein